MKNASLAIVVRHQNSSPSSWPPIVHPTKVLPNDVILLVQRSDVPVWVLPGGGIEEGETPEVAAIRETYEESGIPIHILEHVATYDPVNTLTRTTHVFLCMPQTDVQPHIQDHDVVDARFFPFKHLPKALFPIHRTFIDEWKNTSTLPIRRPLHEVTYVTLIKLFCSHPWWILRYFWTRLRRRG